ncbi:MAG: YHS domain-containing protein, partial [Fimbriimonadaceae bacterium]|nr:YHS domain-containing protein [Alphaproteobacteria bacterium]
MTRKDENADQSVVDFKIDPVCGMQVDPTIGKPTFVYKDETYYFCSPRCAERFAADPDKYLNKSSDSCCHEAHSVASQHAGKG